MAIHTISAFTRHLNPLTWYIRAIYLIIICYFSYIRSWKGVLIPSILMGGSIAWFIETNTIDFNIQTGLAYEKILLNAPFSAIITILVYAVFVILLSIAFWKRSIKIGLFTLNAILIGKMILGLIFIKDTGWSPISATIFGLIIVNRIGLSLSRKMQKQNNSTHSKKETL